MLEAMIAMVVFALGIAGIILIYDRTAPAPYQNEADAAVQMVADGFFATASANLPSMPVTVTSASSASALPAFLQGWFTQSSQELPGLVVSVQSGDDAIGDPCSSTSCGLQLTLSWQQLGEQRTQVFHGQVGIH